MNISKRTTITLTLLVFAAATTISAYQLLNPKRTWSSAPTYIVDDRGQASISDNDKGISATVNAITSTNAWNNTQGGVGTVVNAVSGSVANFTLGDGVPMLNFEDPTGQCSGSCLAATFTGFYERAGGRGKPRYTITDADIVTNTAYDWTSKNEPGGCSGEFSIEAVQVHEIGHGLGLGHSSVAGSTMFPSVSSCDTGPEIISADDIAGICDLYGCSGGPPPPTCTLGQKGDSCSLNGDCCSGKCRGSAGNKTCK